MSLPHESGASATAVPTGDDQTTWRIDLRGQLDLASIAEVHACIEEVLAHRPQRIVIDLSELSFMDSTGIELLLSAAQHVESVELRHPSDIIRSVIESTGLSELLRIAP